MKNKAVWGAVALIALVAFWIERHSGSGPETQDSPIAAAAADTDAPDVKSILSASLDYKYGIGWQISVTNIGQAPITMQQFQVNGRADCDSKGGDLPPKTLKVGDVAELYSPCANVVRVHIGTDQGEADFTFDPVTHLAD